MPEKPLSHESGSSIGDTLLTRYPALVLPVAVYWLEGVYITYCAGGHKLFDFLPGRRAPVKLLSLALGVLLNGAIFSFRILTSRNGNVLEEATIVTHAWAAIPYSFVILGVHLVIRLLYSLTLGRMKNGQRTGRHIEKDIDFFSGKRKE